MRNLRFRVSFLLIISVLFALLLTFSAYAAGEEESQLSVTLSEAASATVTIEVDGVAQTGSSVKVAAGKTVKITVAPASGYRFEKWTAPSALPDLMDSQETVISFTMPDSDVSFSAVMKKAEAVEYNLSILINDTSFGAADVNDSYWGATVKERKFRPGDSIVIKANANSGYRFVKWDDINSTLAGVEGVDLSAKELRFTMPDRNVSLYLEYEPIVYYFDVVIQGEGTVEIEGKTLNEAGKYECTVGEEIAILATPGEEYVFLGWYGNNYADFENFDEAHTTLICPASDFTVTANFASSFKEMTPIATQGGSIHLGTVSGVGSSAVPSGEPVRCGVDQIYRLEAIPDRGYVFSHWETSHGGISEDKIKSSVAEFTMPNFDCTVTAVFTKGSYRVIVSTRFGGEVQGPEGTFEMGSTVSLKATPYAGYEFSHWDCKIKDVVANTEASETTAVVPGSDVEIQAVFILKTVIDPNTSGSDLTDDGDGFPWLAILVIFLLSSVAIALIIVREKYNLSYGYLIKKLFKKQ